MVRCFKHDHSSDSILLDSRVRFRDCNYHLTNIIIHNPQEDTVRLQLPVRHDHLISQSSCTELGQSQWSSSVLDSKHSSACRLNITKVNKTRHDSSCWRNLGNDPKVPLGRYEHLISDSTLIIIARNRCY